jgi:hypothetical protein
MTTNEKITFNGNKEPQITGETDHLHNKKKHYRKQTVIGQKSIENNDFKGADKKVWLFISNRQIPPKKLSSNICKTRYQTPSSAAKNYLQQIALFRVLKSELRSNLKNS